MIPERLTKLDRRSAPAVLLATLALAACSGTEKDLPKGEPASSPKDTPELIAGAKETNPPAVTETNTSATEANICDITTSLGGATAPVMQEGITAKDALIAEAPYIEEHFGVDEDVFKQAVESGQIKTLDDTSEGPAIPGTQEMDKGSVVGFRLQC